MNYVIYIPGLNDHQWPSQFRLVRAWRIFGVKPYIFRMNWAAGEPFARTFKQLLDLIDDLTGQGHRVSLVGVSAGASVVLNAFANRPQSAARMVCLCGKIQNGQTISPATLQANPAFKESLAMLPGSLNALQPDARARILSIHPLADNSVPVADTKLDGAVERTIPTIGHGFSIFYGLTLGSFGITRFCKK